MTPAEELKIEADIALLKEKIVEMEYKLHLSRECRESTYHDCSYMCCREYDAYRELKR